MGVGVVGVVYIWVFEWFVGGDVVMVIVNIDIGNGDFYLYVFMLFDSVFMLWSGLIVFGIGFNYIDICVVRLGGIYYVFIKNEIMCFLEYVMLLVLMGFWIFVGCGDWVGFGMGGFEGFLVVKFDDGIWCMYFDL